MDCLNFDPLDSQCLSCLSGGSSKNPKDQSCYRTQEPKKPDVQTMVTCIVWKDGMPHTLGPITMSLATARDFANQDFYVRNCDTGETYDKAWFERNN